MRFIGKLRGFSQRHFDDTESKYCPPVAVLRTKELVRSRVTLESVRNDVLSFGVLTSASRPNDPMFDEVVREAAQVWELPLKVAPIHLNDLPKYHLDTDSSSPGIPWRVWLFYEKGSSG
ncbi:hypothetical protein Zmor_003867 [Zophobas morio]|uniref:Uncharacterized protein n=1 Tax=Zophobas morio TaxID=2755281 RepID=A0AA38HT38_9CUCU|nr:hypothetical protein Zmor_003867 [Zophobas morio]